MDYIPEQYDVMILAGQTSASYSIQIVDDRIPESNETFTIAINPSSLPTNVMIASPAGDPQADSPGNVSVTILDDDRKL